MKIQHLLKRVAAASLLAWPQFVLAQGFNQQVDFEGTASGTDLVGAITNVINIILMFAALVAAIYLIIGGLRYITSGSNEEGQEKAKNTILYAIIGLIVIALSAVIVNFVVNIF